MESTFFWDNSPTQAGDVPILPHDNDALMTFLPPSHLLAFSKKPVQSFPVFSFSLGLVESTFDMALVNPLSCHTHPPCIHISRLY